MVRTSLAFLFLGLAAPAFAQDGGLEADLQKAATASPAELEGYARASLTTVTANAKIVRGLTEAARTSADSEVLSCLTPKDTSSKALVQVTELSVGNLVGALGSGDDKGVSIARHNYRKIAVSLDKSENIRAEAQQCDGDSGSGGDGRGTTVEGGVGRDSDTADGNQLSELEISIDAPSVSPFEP